MNKLIPALLALTLIATAVSSAQNAKPALKDLPAAYAKAIDDENPDAFAALFNEDAVFNDLGIINTGRAEIRAFGQKIMDVSGKYVTREVKVEGERITWLFDFNNSGGYRLRGQGDFVTRNGLIQTLEIKAQR